MSGRPLVLIHVDDRRRDATTLNLLGLLLEARGCRTVFTNRATLAPALRRLAPAAVLVSHIQFVRDGLAALARRARVYLLPTENAIFNPRSLAIKESGLTAAEFDQAANPHDRHARQITAFFAWGEAARQALLEHGVYRPDQIVVAGNPRFDLLRLGAVAPVAAAPPAIGIVGRYPVLNVFDHRSNLQFIYSMRNEHGIRYDLDRNVEDFYWYHIAYFRTCCDVMDALIASEGVTVNYRPHQYEDWDGYRFLQRTYGARLVIEPDDDYFEWLARVRVLLASASTSVAEAFVAGRPVVTMEKMVGPRLAEHIQSANLRIPFMQYCYQPATLADCLDLLREGLAGRLAPAVGDAGEYGRLITHYFDHPRAEPGCATIARTVAEAVAPVGGSRWNEWRYHAGLLPARLARALCPHRFRIDRNANYYPWDRAPRAKAARLAARIPERER